LTASHFVGGCQPPMAEIVGVSSLQPCVAEP